MMHWNVTYNDPNRWKEVHAICGPKWPWMDAMRQTLKGRPLGSPKLDLVGLEGLGDLQSMRDDLTHRTPVNFQRTQGGVMAFTKVRLEVYAIPIRRQELELLRIEPSETSATLATLTLEFKREGHSVRILMEGTKSMVNRMESWFRHGLHEQTSD
ncbi:hypothetical protein N9L13_04390 [Flavobacteriales bacterium]|jgi:hypothetical protein|nr:hypothetical protein [Flavobacteriales bacterium]